MTHVQVGRRGLWPAPVSKVERVLDPSLSASSALALWHLSSSSPPPWSQRRNRASGRCCAPAGAPESPDSTTMPTHLHFHFYHFRPLLQWLSKFVSSPIAGASPMSPALELEDRQGLGQC